MPTGRASFSVQGANTLQQANTQAAQALAQFLQGVTATTTLVQTTFDRLPVTREGLDRGWNGVYVYDITW